MLCSFCLRVPDVDEVCGMLRSKYGGQFMIWNLSEKSYDYEKFDNQVREEEHHH
jgi:hypothetical protein